MMISSLRRIAAALFVGLGFVLCSTVAHADPPYRVARLAYESGGVSFSPAGENDWSRASVNRPLVTGDRLWVDANSRAELQLDGAALRVGDQTSLQLLNIDDRIAQLQLTQGAIDLRVWRMAPDQSVEIDTPNLAFVIRRPGVYRIDVSEKFESTAVTVRAGEATLYGEGNAFVIRPGDSWEFYDTALRDYDTFRPQPDDDLARFAASRDRAWEASVSARYVSREVIGFQELDAYGQWQQTQDYGWVWFPTRVAAGWAPYREGHWAWVEPWGWSWVDDAPWGFAPSHYGRWAFVRERWCWVPGPVNVRPVYAPALVTFVGAGSGVVGWFPLAPREVYRPAYTTSREYFTRVNVTNTTVNVTQMTNIYERREAPGIVYRNQRVPGAVVAVPTATFTQARPVGREAVRVRAEDVHAQAVMPAPAVAPARQSVFGPQAAQRKPPERAFTRPVVAQTQPPAPLAPIESRLPALRSHPGRPAEPSAAQAKPAVPAPAVRVVPAQQPAAAAPQPSANVNRPERERRGPPERRTEQAPAPSAVQPPAPAMERRREDERGRGEERQREHPPFGRPAAPAIGVTPAPAPAVQPPAAAPSPVPPPAPAVERRREEERARGEERQRERPALNRTAEPATPPAAPSAPQAPQIQPRAAARPPEATPPAPRQRQEQRREERQEERRDAGSAAGRGQGHRQPEDEREQRRQ